MAINRQTPATSTQGTHGGVRVSVSTKRGAVIWARMQHRQLTNKYVYALASQTRQRQPPFHAGTYTGVFKTQNTPV